ncbi:hypothetical protein Nham_3408 [Nitrobacter hamburgensis X14]|uniref:Uncharacterized protein n=1 Tax=Nitrobacter hamburgensis (strain DSM 10229 / NCIMB 13809 / X14) TaxID=323097 RepID=Q1QI09_NITHX|nr:hypothetical protein Nham_3408 [Nitrobacter hamburgensis X14]
MIVGERRQLSSEQVSVSTAARVVEENRKEEPPFWRTAPRVGFKPTALKKADARYRMMYSFNLQIPSGMTCRPLPTDHYPH